MTRNTITYHLRYCFLGSLAVKTVEPHKNFVKSYMCSPSTICYDFTLFHCFFFNSDTHHSLINCITYNTDINNYK